MEKKNIIITGIAVLVGLLIGYLMFGGGESISNHSDDDEHNHSAEVTPEKDIIWTCSMHPQIRRSEPGNCPICGMTLIPADDNGNNNPLVIEMTKESVKLSQVLTSIVGGESISSVNQGKLKLSGKIQANETTTASIVSHIPGRIEKLYISFTGERVSKGQKIATIYSPNLITAQKELIEANKVKNVQPTLFEATKNKLKYWKVTDKQIDEIIAENKVKEYFNIYADHSGVVTKRMVSVGDHLMEGGVLFEIQNLNKLWVVFDVYETDLLRIKKGDVVKFTTPSVPNKEFTARISFIDPVINPKTRAGSARVEITNTNHQLMPEMFVNGELTLKDAEISNSNQILTVPKTAVLWTGERSVVYVKLPDTEIPSYEYREVSIGESVGENFVVLAGLKLGEEVVINGAFVIDASAQLNNQASMMNRSVVVTNQNDDSNEEEMKCDGSMDMESGKKTQKKD